MEHLHELRDRVLALPTLEKRFLLLREEIRKEENAIAELRRQYEKESRDVDQIENESFSAFLFRLIGKYDDKLEKERREEIEAKLAYDRAVTRRESLKRDAEELAARLSVLRGEEQKYRAELDCRRQKLAGNSAPYNELEEERKIIAAQAAEITEALNAAARVKATAQNALESLESAHGWATYDAFTRGGIFSHMLKYSHIDEAEANFHTLAAQLEDFRQELKDVNGLTVSGLSAVTSTQRAVDFWFDNIFTDLSVRNQIEENAEEIERLLGGIGSAQEELAQRLQTEEAKLADNRRREEELLLSWQ